MDAELRAKWVKALRSGEYRQCRGGLVDSTSHTTEYCCLGVLWEIEGRPRSVDDLWRKHFGPRTTTECHTNKLIELNDEQGKSFSEIADYIERNL